MEIDDLRQQLQVRTAVRMQSSDMGNPTAATLVSTSTCMMVQNIHFHHASIHSSSCNRLLRLFHVPVLVCTVVWLSLVVWRCSHARNVLQHSVLVHVYLHNLNMSSDFRTVPIHGHRPLPLTCRPSSSSLVCTVVCAEQVHTTVTMLITHTY